ncbi:hypothetical protein GCM10023231_40070 [Olivibacter ginsenosidimutans]|uniref:Sigma-70 family RNA polymerase sigma factor n=1 Tax=Olivibacter ginsenosidimutans TaxID=1176537 RepID=A0ABP9C9L1_9SPHI
MVLEEDKKQVTVSDGVFLQLYKKVFPTVARYIGKRGGTLEEAKDVFQDALLIYYERVQSGSTPIRNTEKGYIFGISKHLWIRRFKQQVTMEPLNEQWDVPETKEETIADRQIVQMLKQAGERCMQLLKSFYYEQLTMADLAKRFGFASERSATVQKFKCLEKVRDFVKKNIGQYEDIIN